MMNTNLNIKKLKKPFLIGEIGINHNGNVKLAKKLIDLASKYKFDCVKFQKRTPEICIPDYQKQVYIFRVFFFET